MHRKFTDLSYKTKLFVSYILIVMIPMSILVTYSLFQARNLIIDNTIKSAERDLQATSDSIKNRIDRCNQIVASMSANEKLRRMFFRNGTNITALTDDINNFFDPYLDAIIHNNEQVERITVYSRTSIPERGENILSIKNIEDKQWFRDIEEFHGIKWFYEEGRLFVVCDFYYGDIKTKLGIIYLEVKQEWMFSEFVRFNAEEFPFYVVEQDMRVVYPPSADVSDVFVDVPGQKNIKRQINGESYVFVKGPAFKNGWTIWHGVAQTTLNRGIGKILTTNIFIMLLCLAIVTIITKRISNSFANRILALNEYMIMLENGQFDMKINSNSNDEIGSLTNRFGRMVKRLNELMEIEMKSKIELQRYELKVLQSQIKPHFLYNVLSSINWKAVESEAYDVAKAIRTLSRFYRTCLSNGADIVPFSVELENIESFINLPD